MFSTDTWGLMNSVISGSLLGLIDSLRGLLGIELDDELFANWDIDLVALRERQDLALKLLDVDLEPTRDLDAGRGDDGGLDDRHVPGLRGDGHHVTGADPERRDVHALAVDEDVVVTRRLAGLVARSGEPETVDHVVQPALEQAKEVLARDALLAGRDLIVVAELLLEQTVRALRLLLLAKLDPVLRVTRALAAGHARREGTTLDTALVGVAAVALQEELDSFAAAESAVRACITCHRGSIPPCDYTRRRLRGRQPLCGTGVQSWMLAISKPAAWSERIAVSRPEPGPLTKTETLRRPCSWAFFAHCSAAICAAKGVDLREPLKPTVPADCHAITLPEGSVIEMIVLLKVLLMCAAPTAMFLRSLRLTRVLAAFFFGAAAIATYPSSSRRSGGADPCAYARWCGCAVRAPADRDGDEDRGSSRSP